MPLTMSLLLILFIVNFINFLKVTSKKYLLNMEQQAVASEPPVDLDHSKLNDIGQNAGKVILIVTHANVGYQGILISSDSTNRTLTIQNGGSLEESMGPS